MRVLALVAIVLASFVTVSVVWGEAIVATVTHRIGAPPRTRPAQPLRVGEPSVRFVAAGDVGTGDASEYRTAKMVAELAAGDPYDALVLLGDNVYPDGDPARLPETVFEPFAAVLGQGTQLVPVLGNHDVEAGHGDAQAAALGMPARWYAASFGEVDVVALDSTQPGNRDQLRWLDETLASSDARWVIAALHHPAYSSGWHGSDTATRDAFAAIFERHGVQLVLSGHDHDYQRSHPIGGVTYVVSGGAAKTRRTGQADFTAVAWSTNHFVEIVATETELALRAITADGEQFDRATLTNPNQSVTTAAVPAGRS